MNKFAVITVLAVVGIVGVAFVHNRMDPAPAPVAAPVAAVGKPSAVKSDAAAPSAEVKKLMEAEEVLNDRCRGGSGDDPETSKVCDIRDRGLEKIRANGWCWGHEGQDGAHKDWEPCTANPDPTDEGSTMHSMVDPPAPTDAMRGTMRLERILHRNCLNDPKSSACDLAETERATLEIHGWCKVSGAPIDADDPTKDWGACSK